MFINGYAFPIFIFLLMYLLSAFILGEVSLDATMPYVCALLLFIPVFFAAIDIPFTTKPEQAE